MMPNGNAVLLLVALAGGALPGCGASAPARFYRLDSAATPNGAPSARTAVMVGPIALPAAVDRPEFVVQVAPNRVEVEEFDRWAAPLDDSIARAVAGDLSATRLPERYHRASSELHPRLCCNNQCAALRIG